MSQSDNLKILYEDNHLIAVFKPAGILVQADSSGRESLMNLVKTFLKNRDQKSGNVFLGLLHRLDKNVSGIVLLAKTSKGASRLSEQFRNHTIVKKYTAILEGDILAMQKVKVNELREVKLWLSKNEKTLKTAVFSDELTGAQQRAKLSVLRYGCQKVENNRSLVSVWLETGRFHQIRATMAFLGCPIVGDKKYGALQADKKFTENNIALTADYLEFTTATSGERIKLSLVPFTF